MDRWGDPPNRAYLVNLKEQVDSWVEAGRPGSFYRYADEHFGGANASPVGAASRMRFTRRFLERERVPPDYSVVYKTQLSGVNKATLNLHQELGKFVRDYKLEFGFYLVCVGQQRLDHCFVLMERLGCGRLMIYDG
ncbi:hypothetical protein GQ600_11869 [Phytophthora cactorum]|nr:hypothetical protein GQ600_11869 [Phytophthora cactorum]